MSDISYFINMSPIPMKASPKHKDLTFKQNYRIRLKQENRQSALLSISFLSVSIFTPSKSLLAGRFATQQGDLCNTFHRPDGGVEGDRSSRNLPEQSAASRCRLIVSES